MKSAEQIWKERAIRMVEMGLCGDREPTHAERTLAVVAMIRMAQIDAQESMREGAAEVCEAVECRGYAMCDGTRDECVDTIRSLKPEGTGEARRSGWALIKMAPRSRSQHGG